jgi:muconolactone delta-isomerase
VPFLTLSRRRTDRFTDAQFAALAEQEARRVEELKAAGQVAHVWRRADLEGACMVWNAENEDQLRELLASLPFYQAGMLEILSMIPLTTYNNPPAKNGASGKPTSAR